MGLQTVPPSDPRVEATRKEVRSSLVAKYAKHVMANMGREAPPPFKIVDCITNQQAQAFVKTVWALGKTIPEIKSKLAAEFRRELAKIKVV